MHSSKPSTDRASTRPADTGGRAYAGRFAPSPTGLLHAGSLVAALGSWLDARAHGGRWLVRIEDLDPPRCVPGADRKILAQLAAVGLHPDAAPVWQSARGDAYIAALDRLKAQGDIYACACTRREIELALDGAGRLSGRHADLPYPGTCRRGLGGREARAWRVRCGKADAPLVIEWQDRRLGPQKQNLTEVVGDFVVRRADGLWAYQLAVVVDDAAQGVTDVVRGQDLADSTPRQIHLQRLLGLATPRYMHLPLVLADDGEKLSKQNGAQPIDLTDPAAALRLAARALGLGTLTGPTVDAVLAEALVAWTGMMASRPR